MFLLSLDVFLTSFRFPNLISCWFVVVDDRESTNCFESTKKKWIKRCLKKIIVVKFLSLRSRDGVMVMLNAPVLR